MCCAIAIVMAASVLAGYGIVTSHGTHQRHDGSRGRRLPSEFHGCPTSSLHVLAPTVRGIVSIVDIGVWLQSLTSLEVLG